MNLFRKTMEYTPVGLFKKGVSGTINTLFSKSSTRDNDPLSALFSDQAYTCGRSGSMNDDCVDDINKSLSDTGYSIVPELSDTHISTYKNDTGDFGISHRGTCTTCSDSGKDLMADGGLAVGFNTSMPSNRLDRTEEIVRKIKSDSPDSNIKLSGHSLGGHTSAFALANSPYLQKNVDTLSTYNLGANPLFSALLPLDTDKNTKKLLDAKTTHYRKRGDWISAGMVANPVFGSVKSESSGFIYNPLKEHNITNFYSANDFK